MYCCSVTADWYRQQCAERLNNCQGNRVCQISQYRESSDWLSTGVLYTWVFHWKGPEARSNGCDVNAERLEEHQGNKNTHSVCLCVFKCTATEHYCENTFFSFLVYRKCLLCWKCKIWSVCIPSQVSGSWKRIYTQVRVIKQMMRHTHTHTLFHCTSRLTTLYCSVQGVVRASK